MMSSVILFFSSQKKLALKPHAASLTEYTISSMDQVWGVLSNLNAGDIVTLNIPYSTYDRVYGVQASSYCASKSNYCNGPFTSKFSGNQNIIGTGYLVKINNVQFTANYYLYAGGGQTKTMLTSCIAQKVNCTVADSKVVQYFIEYANQPFNLKSNRTEVLSVRIDLGFLRITIKILPILPTPKPSALPHK